MRTLDLHSVHRTFRSAHWRAHPRRNKNIRTILGDLSKKEAAAAAAASAAAASGTTTPAPSKPAGGIGGDTPMGKTEEEASENGINGDKNRDGGGDDLSTSGTSTPLTMANGGREEGGVGIGLGLQQASRSLSKLVLERNLKESAAASTSTPAVSANAASVGAGGPAVTYTNIESAPSLAAARHYCDVTGLPAPYIDPKTRLRYHNREVFQLIRSLPQNATEGYLEARGAHVVLK